MSTDSSLKGSDPEKATSTFSHDGTTTHASETINEKKLMRKIDFHVLPCISIMYLWAFLDR
jgi:hypothetical protein